MGTHLRVLSEGYSMKTKMTGFRWFSKIFASLWTKVASALEGLFKSSNIKHVFKDLVGYIKCMGIVQTLFAMKGENSFEQLLFCLLLLLFCTFNEAIVGLLFCISTSWG